MKKVNIRMKKWARLVSIMLVLFIAFAQIAMAASDFTMPTQKNTTDFSDVKGHWCENIINKFYKNGWVEGYEDKSFKPDSLVTRAEFTAMVIRILKKLDKTQVCTFNDISPQDWFYPVVASASKEKYIEGYNDGTFKPYNNMNRQEVAVFVKRLLNVIPQKDGKIINFNDQSEISSWSVSSVMCLVLNGVVDGYPDGTFRPGKMITRAEAVKMLDVTLRIIDEEKVPESGDIKVDDNKSTTSSPISSGSSGSSSGSSSSNSSSSNPSKPVVNLDIDLQPVKIDTSSVVTDPQTLEISSSAAVEIKNNKKDGNINAFEVILFEDANLTGKYESSDNIIGRCTVNQAIASGSSITVSVPLKGKASFMGNLIYAFVDDKNDIHETDEENNIINNKPFANLDIDLQPVKIDTSGVATDPQTLEISSSAAIEIKNNKKDGNISAFEVILFEDTNLTGKYENSDNIIGRCIVNQVITSESSITVSVPLKGKVSFMGNLIYAFVDDKNNIHETDEENNIINNKAGCELRPVVGNFNPILKWKWTASNVNSDSLNIMMTPSVIDLDGDKIPEIVFGSTVSRGGGLVEVGILRAIKGNTGEEVFSVTDSNYAINTTSSIATGDIDGDKMPEIIACDTSGARLMAFENDGTFKWRSPDLEAINWGAPSICDIDSDGKPEIIIGRQVLNNDGSIRWTGTYGRGSGSNGPISFAEDIDMDGKYEMVCGNTVYRNDGTVYFYNNNLPDGLDAVGNFDDDPYPEIVLVSGGKVWLLEHDMKVKWGPVSLPGGGSGGAPTVADFDSDGKPEIGVAGANDYTVFDSDGSVLWSSLTQDGSSNVTGSSVFDFEGDGSYEVVYRDELYLRIYSGKDGKVLFKIPMSSCTWYEYPLVADVDNDNNAEILTVANDNCRYGTQRGVYVFGDANDTWVNTRKVWNQHAYDISNVGENGSIPLSPQNNWNGFNNFRCNQSGDALACVDLTGSYLRLEENKDVSSSALVVRVGSAGNLYVAPGKKVAFYDGNPKEGGTLLGVTSTSIYLNPGEYEDVRLPLNNKLSGKHTIYAAADDYGTGLGSEREINENNNTVFCEFEFDNAAKSTTPGGVIVPGNTPDVPKQIAEDIEVGKTYDMINSTSGAVIIDVRTPEEFAEGHLKGAINVNYNSENFNQEISKLPRNGKYIVYCKAGSRSINAMNIMKSLSFREVYNMLGGIDAWSSKGYIVEKN